MFGWLFPKNRDLGKLEERLEKVERGLVALTDDWGEFHEKVQRAVWRAAKRKEPLPGDEELPVVPPEQPARNTLRAPAAAPLGNDPISARIRAGRGRRFTVIGGE